MTFICPGGEIGRRTTLRGWRRKVYEFESRSGHIALFKKDLKKIKFRLSSKQNNQ